MKGIFRKYNPQYFLSSGRKRREDERRAGLCESISRVGGLIGISISISRRFARATHAVFNWK